MQCHHGRNIGSKQADKGRRVSINFTENLYRKYYAASTFDYYRTALVSSFIRASDYFYPRARLSKCRHLQYSKDTVY